MRGDVLDRHPGGDGQREEAVLVTQQTAIRTVADLIGFAARQHPDRVAVVGSDGMRLSYRELADRGTRLANSLLACGLDRGDRVAAWLEDGPAYVELYIACALAGLVVVPVNARYTAGETRHLLVDSGARALLYDDPMRERAAELADVTCALVLVAASEHLDLRSGSASTAPTSPAPDDLFILGYTSGTTGLPKGALLTHRSVLAIARLNALSYRLPIASVAALTGWMSFVAVVPAHILSHFYVGGTVVFPGKWDVDSLSHLVSACAVTFTYVPSPLIAEFAASAARHPARWATVSTLLHSASKANPGKLGALAEVFGSRLVEGWGMTENSGGLVTATVPADVVSGEVCTTVGRPVTETAVRLAGPDGQPLPQDGETVGELLVRSPALADGYWRQPEATAAAFRGGWYATGDLGTIDTRGYVRIMERRSDLIVSGGMNVYPSEVERVIAGDPRVAACAVVGVPHERWGHAVAAAVVRAPGAVLTEDDVIAWCRCHLASYKKPTRVIFLDVLPTTASMKVSRAAVHDLL
jgi:acyl-CoA synthetase (AMP-forming)/AMP-acid ligase II